MTEADMVALEKRVEDNSQNAAGDTADFSCDVLALIAEVRALASFARRVTVRTKHGPMGSGADGPCDADCVKCEAERILKENGR